MELKLRDMMHWMSPPSEHRFQCMAQLKYKKGEIQRGKDETFLRREIDEGFFGTDGNTKPIPAHAHISNN